MINPYSRTEMRALLARHGIKLTKSLGQNLLMDRNITEKIAGLLEPQAGELIIEAGPGTGTLTLELARRVGGSGRVVAVEIDGRIIPALREVTRGAAGGAASGKTSSAADGDTSGAADGDTNHAGNIEIAHMDFLDYKLEAIPAGYKLTGNLPYYITTPIIMKAMESDNIPALMVFMIQKEVAARITASPGGREYGAVSVAVRYRSRAEYAMDVSREVFMPKPHVDSAVIKLNPEHGIRGTPRDESLFFAVVKAGFGQRRKMLRNALKEIAGSADRLEAAFERSGVKGTARAETLDVEEFIALSDALL